MDDYQDSGRGDVLLRDEQPSSAGAVMVRLPERRPRVTYALLGLTVIVYLLQMATKFLLDMDIPAALGLKSNELILAGQWWRLLTPMLLHGSIMHLGFNMYALFVLGPDLERFYGSRRFLGLYLVSGFAGNVVSMIFSPAPSLGSSTAIFGLLGAQGVFLYQNREFLGGNARRALVNIVTLAVINFIIGLSPGIDNWGHLGGLLGGVLFAWFAGPVLQVQGAYPDFVAVDTRSSSRVAAAWVGDALLWVLLAGYWIVGN